VVQFGAHGLGHKQRAEQTGQKLYFFDQNQIMQRACICDNTPHIASKTETLYVLPLSLNRGNRIGFVDLVRLENTIEFAARLNPEHAPQLRLGQATKTICLDGYSFERLPLHVAAGAEPLGKIVGYLEEEIHGSSSAQAGVEGTFLSMMSTWKTSIPEWFVCDPAFVAPQGRQPPNHDFAPTGFNLTAPNIPP